MIASVESQWFLCTLMEAILTMYFTIKGHSKEGYMVDIKTIVNACIGISAIRNKDVVVASSHVLDCEWVSM